MNLRKSTFGVLLLLALVSSCKKDDDDSIPFVEADRTEQQVIDGDSLIGYLQTHYYNSGTFETPGDYSIDEIIINELPVDEVTGEYLPMPNPSVNTMLIDAVETRTTTYLDVEYTYYFLKLNEGAGESPHFTDAVLANYEGMMQDGDVFDNTINAQSPFNLLDLVQGWRLVMPEFKSAESYVLNDDGTLSYNNYGLGVMFFPSGLGYFGLPPVGVNSYANLIFKFALYQTEINDNDSDFVPSYLEDLDNNGNVYDDDTDGDGIPNFLDTDDDGDGVLTRYEDIDHDGNPMNDDTDGDGVPNYLDRDTRIDNRED
ncbi:hypothetical protein M0G43_04580 [Subsaxibacter sp. CAU 1640]|uniref:FKBP-type peptidyl-prolyl cis-trans isomerase n=1 Tax=Subsaxibacter sp. CAU 1640 TaxID=2933271 RepID=UPI0020068F53|nr:hypothetical protein [Subsaxibacter sp. CAU 1640]MCK7589842.1 hypothetical protein [Subsaxibacter sp. CAU 1640]